MALTGPLKPKRSTVSGEVPQSVDLEIAEIAVNTADGKLFTKHTDGSIVTISGGGSGGGGGVDSVNGKTGVVSLGIQDMDDYEYSPDSFRFNVLYRTVPGPGEIGTSNTTDENYLYISKTDQDGKTVDLSLLQADVAAALADPNNVDFPSIYNLNGAFGTTSRSVYRVNENATFYELLITGNPVEGTGGRGWPYANCDSGCNPLTNSFPDGAKMVFGVLTPPNGNVLQWSDTDQKFKPAQLPVAPVDSVNGQTGIVEIGVEQLDDFALVPSNGEYAGLTSNQADGADCANPGEWRLSLVDLSGFVYNSGSASSMQLLQVGDQVTFKANGVSDYTTTVTAADAPNVTFSNYIDTNADFPAEWFSLPVGTAVILESSAFSVLDIPLADGDVLTYNAVRQEWNPQQPPSAGAVDSVNGKTGVVSLGIQDQDDFGLLAAGAPFWATECGGCAIPAAGQWSDQLDDIRIDSTDSNGFDHLAALQALGVGSDIWVSQDGVAWTKSTVNSYTAFGASAPTLFLIGVDAVADPTTFWPTAAYLSPTDPSSLLVPLANNDILQWNEGAQKFYPAQLPSNVVPPVDSVNGETGAVSLGIQDMDDFGLNLLGATRSAATQIFSATFNPPSSPDQYNIHATVDTVYVSSTLNGVDESARFDALAGETVILSIGDVSIAATINSVSDKQNGASKALNSLSASVAPLRAADTSLPLVIEYAPWATNNAPLAKGDILQWNDTDQKFKPAQLPAIPNVPVDSVNGETGVVSLGIQDMDDFGAMGSLYFSTHDITNNWTGQSTDYYRIHDTDSSAVRFTTRVGGANKTLVSAEMQATNGSVTYLRYGDKVVGPMNSTINQPSTSYLLLDGGSAITPEISAEITAWGESGGGIYFYSPALVSSAAQDAIFEGDILQWNDADQKFKPAQLPAGVEEAPEDGTPYARQDATWVSVSSGGGGSTVSDLADLDDVETSAPVVGEVVYRDDGIYRHASISELVAGRATVTGTVSSTITADTNMAGINGFYADDAALIADGFTHVPAANDLDDSSITVADIADWFDYSTVNYLGQGFTSLPEIKVNSNGSVYLHTTNVNISARNDNYASDHSSVSLCVSWFSQDSEIRRMGWKEITQDGTDWFVVRVDMKVPYNNETGGYPLETWFGKDGRIRQYWGDKIGTEVSINSGTTRQGVSTFATNLTSVNLSGTVAGKRVDYTAAGALVGFAGAKLEDLSDVGTPTDGEALTYDAATTSWTTTAIPAPSPVPVDSVNGEIGAVSLGIQDMDDYKAPGSATWGNRSNVVLTNGAAEWNYYNSEVRVNKLSDANNVASTAWLSTYLGQSIIVTAAINGGTSFEFTATVTESTEGSPSWWLAVTAGGSNFNAISDGDSLALSEPGIQDGDILQWDAVDQKFKPAQLPAGGGGGTTDLDDLGDVSVPSPGDGQMIAYNSASSKWLPTESLIDWTTVSGDPHAASVTFLGTYDTTLTVGGVTPSISGTITTTPGQFGNAATFNGSSFMNYGTFSAVDMPADFTIDFWVKVDGTGEYGLVTKRNQVGAGAGTWGIITGSGGWKFVDLQTITDYNGTTLTVGQWHHLAVVRSGTQLSTYTDGVRNVSASCTTNFTTTTELRVGNWDTSGTRKLLGLIDDLRFTPGVVRYTGTNFTPPTTAADSVTALSGSLPLENLSNVSAALPSDGEVLTWNESAGVWEPVQLPEVINKAKLQAEVAASTDFADFQARIAAL